MSEQVQKKERYNKNLLLVAIVVLAILNIGQLVLSRMSERESEEMVQSKEMELINTFAKLDTLSRQFDEKVQEIDRLGGEVDSLITIREELENEKRELIRSRNMTQERFEQLREKLEAYELMLVRKDQELARLREVNQVLLAQNTGLQEEKNQLEGKISSLSMQNEELKGQVSMAAALRAVDIRFANVSGSKVREDNEFRANRIEKLRIAFRLDDNPVAELGARRIFLRILDPEKAVIYNAAAGSGSTTVKGREIFYTLVKDILFDNSRQEVLFDYESGSEYKKGTYTIEIYSEGYLMGKESFVVK